MDSVYVRLFKLLPDGGLEYWYTSATNHYGGQCPAVGDTLGTLWNDDDEGEAADELYSVTRRYFFDEFEGESSWVLILRELAQDPVLDRVTKAFRTETAVGRAEEERYHEQRDAETESKLRTFFRPRTVDLRVLGILRFLATQKVGKTYRQIERAGEKTITAMIDKGVVEACGTDADGLVQVRITTAGLKAIKAFNEWALAEQKRRGQR